jgi:hypothetical protein
MFHVVYTWVFFLSDKSNVFSIFKGFVKRAKNEFDFNVKKIRSVGVFCTGKNRVINIVRFSSMIVLQTMKHTMIYPGSGPSLEVIALCPAV